MSQNNVRGIHFVHIVFTVFIVFKKTNISTYRNDILNAVINCILKCWGLIIEHWPMSCLVSKQFRSDSLNIVAVWRLIWVTQCNLESENNFITKICAWMYLDSNFNGHITTRTQYHSLHVPSRTYPIYLICVKYYEFDSSYRG